MLGTALEMSRLAVPDKTSIEPVWQCNDSVYAFFPHLKLDFDIPARRGHRRTEMFQVAEMRLHPDTSKSRPGG